MSGNRNIFVDVLGFLWENKLWWMAPIIIMLALVGALILVGQSTTVTPFLYAVF
ncbi:DUF5989 family protein [Candidatus Altiarchaeota archaeon]